MMIKWPNLSKKQKIILAISFFQIVIIFIQLYKVLNVAPLVSINPIDQEDIIIDPDQNLSHFFEPKPNTLFEFKTAGFEGKFDPVVINNDGLNDRDYPINKETDSFRILTIGDSSTFGWFVKTSENYPEQLESKLNSTLKCTNYKKFEVINLGVGGYDIEYALHRLDTRGKKYDPDLLLWLIQNNDFEEIADYLFPMSNQKYQEILNEGRIELYRTSGITIHPGWHEAQKELMNKMTREDIVKYQFSKLQTISSIYNKKLVMFTFGTITKDAADLITNFSQTNPNTYFYNSIPWMRPNTEAFPDGHPTVTGYTKIANHLFDYLQANKIIPCS